MEYSILVDYVGIAIDAIGVFIITFGILYSLLVFLFESFKPGGKNSPYFLLREHLGKTILIGLELLIAGDIIRSIATPPTLMSVIVLAIIVLIRAFLSIQIEKETQWTFPWTKKSKE